MKVIGNPSALQKLAFVNPSAVKQQGTTRDIYHYVPFAPAQKGYEFFADLNNTKALFKNIDQNKLTTGEALVVKRINLKYIATNPVDDEMVQSIGNLSRGFLGNIIGGKLDLVVGNQTIIKDLSLIKAKPFCRMHSTDEGTFIDLESEIVIPKDVEFKVVIKQLANGAAPQLGFPKFWLGVHLEGYGKILSLDRTI